MIGQSRVCAELDCVQTVSLPMIAAPLPICITVFHSKLCWTTKKLGLCILYLLCSNVCQTLFHVGLVLSVAACTFINRQTHPTCMLTALLLKLFEFLELQLCVYLWKHLILFVSTTSICKCNFGQILLLISVFVRGASSEIQTCYHYYSTCTQSHKGRAKENDLKLRSSTFPVPSNGKIP